MKEVTLTFPEGGKIVVKLADEIDTTDPQVRAAIADEISKALRGPLLRGRATL